jgi:hypothetical protein
MASLDAYNIVGILVLLWEIQLTFISMDPVDKIINKFFYLYENIFFYVFHQYLSLRILF